MVSQEARIVICSDAVSGEVEFELCEEAEESTKIQYAMPPLMVSGWLARCSSRRR